MAENVFTLERMAGQFLLFAHNEHVRRGRARVDWVPATLTDADAVLFLPTV